MFAVQLSNMSVCTHACIIRSKVHSTSVLLKTAQVCSACHAQGWLKKETRSIVLPAHTEPVE